MDEILHTMEDTQYALAVTGDESPTSPWMTPTPEEMADFQARMLKQNSQYMYKHNIVNNKLGVYLHKQCITTGVTWEGSPQQTEYMVMQWNKEKKVSLDDFVEFRTLGRGGFGLVAGVSRKASGAMFANKVQSKLRVKEGKAEKLCMAERKALCEIESPFVVTVHYAFQDALNLYLVMELLSGGDLKYHLEQEGSFSEDVSRYFLACTLHGIGAIHDAGYVYRDLKPENILMSSDGHCKISDLGLATRVDTKKGIKGSAGTRGYWAPEMITKDENGRSKYYGLAVDFWSLGCVAYAFLDGECPFYSDRVLNGCGKKDDPGEAIDNATKSMDIEYPDSFPARGQSLCESLLTRDPTKRLGSGGWKDIESHPFFDDFDFEALLLGNVFPPFVPAEALNAANTDSIGEFAKAKKTIKWDEEDQAKFEDWDFTHDGRFYDEVINSLEWANEDGNCDLRYVTKKSSACVIL